MQHHMAEQVPDWLDKFDDPYGITWRIINSIRRVNLLRTLRFLISYFQYIEYKRPILIVGMPRSGTTMLFHLLRESKQLKALSREGHDVWRAFHHPRVKGWQSDYVCQGEIKFGERKFITSYFFSYLGKGRLLEKTADNCLRIPYLLELFPDAVLLFMKRNPCDVINSLINGWRHPKGRYRSYFVPKKLNIDNYPHSYQWCFSLIEGWQSYIDSSVKEIAFAQWEQYVNSLLAARSLVPAAQWKEIYFENFLTHPTETISLIYEAIGINDELRMQEKLVELLSNPINALTPPTTEKWRSQNREDVQSLLPRIAPLAKKMGYSINPITGNCDVIPNTTKSLNLRE